MNPEIMLPPLYLRVTHINGIATEAEITSVPETGMNIGLENIIGMSGSAKSNLCVANKHVRIFPGEKIWYIESLNNKFITTINDEILAPSTRIAVTPGDVMEIGFTRICFMEHKNYLDTAFTLFQSQDDLVAVDKPEAVREAWQEMTAMAESGDILSSLGHEGLRALNNPELLNHTAWINATNSRHERSDEKTKNLWQICGEPGCEEKNLTDFVLGEIVVDDILTGVNQEDIPDLARPMDNPEDPLALLGPPSRQAGKRMPIMPEAPVITRTDHHVITVDSHYAPSFTTIEINEKKTDDSINKPK